ncbi:MAG: hypothetical protein KKI08_06730 [Armatimonadetes bacterium]|nr:hypothetical protein [Armatimonadota bacterium]
MSTPALPTFQVEDRTFTRLILGHNPFLGYSYISNARSQEYKERFSGPEPIRDVILAAIECGVRSMMISSNEPIAQAIEMAQEQSGVELSNLVIVSPGNVRDNADWLRRVGCQVCLVHGQNTDSFFRRSERTFPPEFAEMLAEIRDCGFVPGMSSHNGGETIPCAEGFDVAVINTPINKIAWRMCPCVEQVLGEVKRSNKQIIAMKPLAMGRVAPAEGMEYIASVPGVNGVVVGIGTAAEAEETFGLGAAALARPAD